MEDDGDDEEVDTVELRCGTFVVVGKRVEEAADEVDVLGRFVVDEGEAMVAVWLVPVLTLGVSGSCLD